jgi:hypothetical protein
MRWGVGGAHDVINSKRVTSFSIPEDDIIEVEGRLHRGVRALMTSFFAIG